MSNFSKLNYDPKSQSRELFDSYISLTETEIKEMLEKIGLNKLSDLYKHIPENVRFSETPNVSKTFEYEELIDHMLDLSQKNNTKRSFIGDGLPDYKVGELVPYVSDLRSLTTAYTPYQPERSQGTLWTLWMYANTISKLTGFEAINASMYDRSTCLFEALNAGMKLTRKSDTVLLCESIYPGDLKVIDTIANGFPMKIIRVPYNKETGITDLEAVKNAFDSAEGKVGAIAFPQVNNLGNLEDVNALTDFARANKIQSIAVIDPMLLATEALEAPVKYGSDNEGCDIIVGEGQHLAIGPNFSGPGLGIFGIRYNAKNKLSIRQTPGRFVGIGKDAKGNEALCMVLSTREQHIRREKATSNICSNQSFIASLAGAAILERGEAGMTEAAMSGRESAIQMAVELSKFDGVELSYPEAAFFNEFVLTLPTDVEEFITTAAKNEIHVGVNVTARVGRPNQLKLSFSDNQNDEDLDALIELFEKAFGAANEEAHFAIPAISDELTRSEAVGLPTYELDDLKKFYSDLDDQNVSPDNLIYPLGSCTMKYNPLINDWAANLEGFTDIHPQAPEADAQGSLEVLYGVQEMFKEMTGMPGIALQPLAGAQGEFAGIKMFQAYHKANGEERDVILIPHSAHGTNPATATAAGFTSKIIDGKKVGIVLIEATECGLIDMGTLKKQVEEYGNRICGIMVTNPNTSGIFETEFKEIAELIHSVGGLVYMDGANMNAIAGWIDLGTMGVDACHNNIHKTWSISHGGGGPGDAIVVVSDKLLDFIPGVQVRKNGDLYETYKAKNSIGELHRHHGQFAHKIRCYSYLKRLGSEGVKKMSACAVLSSRYLHKLLSPVYPTLPCNCGSTERMHEFIMTIEDDIFKKIEEAGTPKATAIAKIGKLFLDFGLHAPTVAFPEVFGLMVEPTESYTKGELDRFAEAVIAIHKMLVEHPEVLTTAPHFTPVTKVDEVGANKSLTLTGDISKLPEVKKDIIAVEVLQNMPINEIMKLILQKHKERKADA